MPWSFVAISELKTSLGSRCFITARVNTFDPNVFTTEVSGEKKESGRCAERTASIELNRTVLPVIASLLALVPLMDPTNARCRRCCLHVNGV